MIPVWRWRIINAYLDPVVGSEESGLRPVVIVSDEDYNQVVNLATVVPLTSKKPGRRVYPNEVLLEAGVAGLPLDSIVLSHQIRTISKKRFKATIGHLDNIEKQGQVLESIRRHLGMVGKGGTWLSR